MAYTTYSASQAVQRANATKTWTTKMCLQFVFHCLTEVSAGLPDADAAWAAAKQKVTTGTPPPGAPVYFRGFAHGHIALSLGGGNIRSTDWPSPGLVGTVNINDLCRAWYGTTANYLGWSRDYAGQIIRGLEETTTNYGGVPSIPTTPTQPTQPAPQEDDMLSPEAQAWIESRMDAHDQYIIASLRNSTTVEGFWTGFNIVKDPSATNPDTAPRVTPSTLLERATWDTKVQRASGPVAALQELADTKTQVLALAADMAELKAMVAALPKG